MFDWRTSKQIKIRITPVESEALAKLVAAKRICASAVICQLIRQHASKISAK